MKLYQLRMMVEELITDAPNYQDIWDLAAEPSTLHRTKRGAKAAATERLRNFLDYMGGDDEPQVDIAWDDDAGWHAPSGVTFLITFTTVRN